MGVNRFPSNLSQRLNLVRYYKIQFGFVTGGIPFVALRPGIPFVSEGYVVMTIELNISKAWDYKMYGHYLLQIPFHINYVMFL